MYYPCSENKGADLLRGYREADLRLSFFAYSKCWFSHGAAHIYGMLTLVFIMNSTNPTETENDDYILSTVFVSVGSYYFTLFSSFMAW